METLITRLFLYLHFGEESQMLMIFMKCVNPVKSPFYVNTAPCINGTYSYVLIKSNITYVENCAKWS
ncbi:hypothetical protein Peur_069098 [Populus x canadensis]